MATQKQKKASGKNIILALKKWMSMSRRQKALAQPQGRGRKKPGATSTGKFYRIVVRPKSEFTSFRNQDVGKSGHIERLAGKRSSGSWDTQTWLISKTDALVKNKTLVGMTDDTKRLISQLSSKPRQIKGDIFEAKPKKNIPERSKPTIAIKRAERKNIRKVQAARRKKSTRRRIR